MDETPTPAPAKKLAPRSLQLPVVAVREGVLFPSTESVLNFGRKKSLAAVKHAQNHEGLVVLVAQKDASISNPKPSDLYGTGTLAKIERQLEDDDAVNALVRGIGRVRIISVTQTEPHLVATVVRLREIKTEDAEVKAMVSHLQKEFRRAVHMGKPVEFLNFMKLMGGVTNSELVDQIASTLNLSTSDKQLILEQIVVKKRIALVTEHLAHELKILEIEKDVVHKTQEKFDQSMRENILRERMRTIQKELGEIDDEEEILDEYETRLKKAKFDASIRTRVKKEIKRLRQMSVNNPEGGYIRSWLDTVFELPWNKLVGTTVDLSSASTSLDQDHYGLDEVKDRVLEYIAVLKLKQAQSGSQSGLPTILCFVGPPGVGKTSIGKSIARSLGREFVKVSLGGIRDEAEIRGHRRTYVGAMPGKIINGIKHAGSANPIFMLDEIDKIGADYKGDPSAALLEALDPEQNDGFEDHYLDMPFDLSKVLFIATANTLDTIPPALRDRLEIIRYSGYTEEEKFQIARNHLLQKVFEGNSVDPSALTVSDEAIHLLIQRYTREAGVRNLQRELSKLVRKVARELVENGTTDTTKLKKKRRITSAQVRKYLGPAPFSLSIKESEPIVGQATGLAWTSVGGDILFIEVALTPGKGQVKLTGKLGEVMKESAQAALTFVKANAEQFKLDPELLTKTNVHVHVPEGAVPKDGPSAGITMVTAIVSAFTNRPVDSSLAMTGEVTLRGRVLKIGGLKEKSIAAHRAGITTILIPKENEPDLEKIPASIRKEITFILVESVDTVLERALQDPLPPDKNMLD